MNLSGSCVVTGGEYDEIISIAGSCKINGNIKCPEIKCSGSVKADGDIVCTGSIETAGSFHSLGSVKADIFFKTAGVASIEGNLKCETLKSSGSLHIGEGIEAENVMIGGTIVCRGLLNAEKTDIKIFDDCNVGSIGGGKITITLAEEKKEKKEKKRLPLFTMLTKTDHAPTSAPTFTVDESIEGDTIALEYVKAPLVIGRVVAIGAGCVIDTIRYQDEIEISPEAKVGRTEKENQNS